MYQKRLVGESEWENLTDEQVRDYIGAYYNNVEEVLEVIRQGTSVRTPFSFFRWRNSAVIRMLARKARSKMVIRDALQGVQIVGRHWSKAQKDSFIFGVLCGVSNDMEVDIPYIQLMLFRLLSNH